MNRTPMHWRTAIACLLLLVSVAIRPTAAAAQLQLASVFSEHMVLQCESPVPIWGVAVANEQVQVEIDGLVHTTTADSQGHWRITLKSHPGALRQYKLSVRSGKDELVFTDVVFGHVWLAAGQSNMAYTVGAMAEKLVEAREMVAGADSHFIRFCKINDSDAAEPQTDLAIAANWEVCTKQNVKDFSAVAYVFAEELNAKLSVPVGIIDCSWGGKPIEPFIPATAFADHPTLREIKSRADTGDTEGIQTMRGGTFVRDSSWLPGTIFNGRIAPIVPYGLRGVIWYQGESNSGRGEDPRDYEHKMRALITGWRDAWKRPSLPVYYVQLPQWTSYAWPYLREEQRRVTNVPHTGMVVTIDLENNNDIHPPNKITVGKRLALWPLSKEYPDKLVAHGPMFARATFRDGYAVVDFDHTNGGLMAGQIKDIRSAVKDVGGTLNGFELIAAEGDWTSADATIAGTQVIVSSPHVPDPIAVRYACLPQAAKDAPWNLYSITGLPATPFCSNWQLMPYDPSKNPAPAK
ncbi:sialate O-acetylesterase [Stieleria varia]|uniref:Sialate O-acetylesterase domain-containing protein n=1 Tax=Stieleria varia TaxID=2528005 RepID=A0A5C6B3R0_9BACT|nr:sialate O-acetylesterase [Stieleria varia]TWU06397.1 hypothetical protein Pla52n_21180 [Stieleria varia]